MPLYENGPVRICYEEFGSGFPLLLISGGGLDGCIKKLTNDMPFKRIQKRLPVHRLRSTPRQ
jgi:hypothetical protein